MAYDLLIKNGRVVDGSGEPAFVADVAVQGGKIVGVGKYAGAAAKRTIDAAGRVVAPGLSIIIPISTRRPCGIHIAARGCITATPPSSSASAAKSSPRSGRATANGISNSSPTRNRSRYRS